MDNISLPSTSYFINNQNPNEIPVNFTEYECIYLIGNEEKGCDTNINECHSEPNSCVNYNTKHSSEEFQENINTVKDVHSLFFGSENYDEMELCQNINELKMTSVTENDVFSVKYVMLILLIKICKYVDQKSGQYVLKKGFLALYNINMPNIQLRWSRIERKLPLNLIPQGLKGLIIQICLCYLAFAEQTKRSKLQLLVLLKNILSQFNYDRYDPKKMLIQLIIMTQKIKTRVHKNLTCNKSLNTNTKTLTTINQSNNGTPKNENGITETLNSNSEKDKIVQKTKTNCGLITESYIQQEIQISCNFDFNTYTYTRFENQRPNIYIARGLKESVTTLINSENKDSNILYRFNVLMTNFIKYITSRIFFMPTVDHNKIMNFLSTSKNLNHSQIEAIYVCINMMQIMNDANNPLVTISWKFIKEWAIMFSGLIKKEMINILKKRVEQNKDIEINFNDEFVSLRQSVEQELHKNYANLFPTFEQMSAVNKICLYLLLGININKQKTGIILYSDLIIKSIFLIWKKTKLCPPDFTKLDADVYDEKFYWNIPLAYLTHFKWCGKNMDEEILDSECTIDEFLSDD